MSWSFTYTSDSKRIGEIIKEIDNRIGEFEGDADAFDDTTMLCFMYKGRAMK